MSRWFGRRDLGDTPDADRRVVQRISDLLDQLQPTRLDPAHQVVERDRGETWVQLRHDSEAWLTIDIALRAGWVNFYGVMGHDEAYSVSSEPRDAWETETLEILSSLLRSTFVLDRYELRDKFWREIVTISEPYSRTLTSGSPLPLRRWSRLADSRHATFDCRGGV